MIVQIPCLVHTYIYYFILFYIRRAILTQTNTKKGLIEEKKHANWFQLLEKHDTSLTDAPDEQQEKKASHKHTHDPTCSPGPAQSPTHSHPLPASSSGAHTPPCPSPCNVERKQFF